LLLVGCWRSHARYEKTNFIRKLVVALGLKLLSYGTPPREYVPLGLFQLLLSVSMTLECRRRLACHPKKATNPACIFRSGALWKIAPSPHHLKITQT
jgi:hypothetical protein